MGKSTDFQTDFNIRMPAILFGKHVRVLSIKPCLPVTSKLSERTALCQPLKMDLTQLITGLFTACIIFALFKAILLSNLM